MSDVCFSGGIGKLVDGVIGGNDRSWLGWSRSPVTVEFVFDLPRRFKAIEIYTINARIRSIDVQFDEQQPITHRPSSKPTPVSSLFVDRVELEPSGTTFVGQRLRIRFEFHDEVFLLTEIKFENEPASVTSTLNKSTRCPTGRCAVYTDKHALFARDDTSPLALVLDTTSSNSTLESSSLVIFTFEWLTVLIVGMFSFGFVVLGIVAVGHRRRRRRLRASHRRLRQNSHLYYKSSQMTATTSGSCASTSSEHDANTLPVGQRHNRPLVPNNYDDLTSEQQSMGSYIYPITSSTSLLQTTPPSSIFKVEQYAVIDGNYSSDAYQQWPTANVTAVRLRATRLTSLDRLVLVSSRHFIMLRWTSVRSLVSH
jgi:hypothetical protein